MKEFASGRESPSSARTTTPATRSAAPFPAGNSSLRDGVRAHEGHLWHRTRSTLSDSYSEHGVDFPPPRVFPSRTLCNAENDLARAMIRRSPSPTGTSRTRRCTAMALRAGDCRRVPRAGQQLNALHGQLRDTLLVITADHGMIDTTEAVDIAKTPALLEPLVLPPSIEPARGGVPCEKPPTRRFRGGLSGDLRRGFPPLFPRGGAGPAACLGRGTPHPKLDDFLGDYLGVATGRRYFAFSLPGRNPGTD